SFFNLNLLGDDRLYDGYPEIPLEEIPETDSEMGAFPVVAQELSSPATSSDEFTAKDGSPYRAPIYIPDDFPIPPEFELRESDVPGAGLGLWTKRMIKVGEKIGPYEGEQSQSLKDLNYGWEVS
uniref:MDS1 and EVI1 complex locus n=1 Tax=Latimeria chalumnae TaxID=7897 RepID=H3BB14_LATCH